MGQGTLGAPGEARRARQPPRGFALLIVLWTLVLLALLISGISAAGRSAANLADNLRGAAVAEAAADGGEATALFRYLDPSAAHWPADGSIHVLRIGQAVVTVSLTDQDGRINPNTAPRVLLVALLRRAGVDPTRAAHLAAAMVDWRSPGPAPSPLGAKAPQYRAADLAWGPPGKPFRSVDELGLVLGMTPALLARLRPHLSVFTAGSVNARLADPLVQAALADTNGGVLPPPTGTGPRTVQITARAVTPGGARFVRRAVLQVDRATGGIATVAWGQHSD